MKAARPTSLTLSLLSCAMLLPVLGGACGAEAPPPDVTTTGGQTAGGGMPPTSTSGAGNPSSTAGTAGIGGTGAVNSSAGAGPTPMGGMSTGGTGGSAGETSSTAGTNAMAGTGGATGGAATGGAAGTGGTTTVDLKETVAGKLNGQMLKGPCLSDFDPLVCKTGNCSGGDNPDFALSGVLTTDTMITLGGDPAKVYTITLHIQGEVEAKEYGDAGDQEKSKQSPMADGFQVGGSPDRGDAYNVYMLRVTAPKQDYFFNALVPPGKSDHTTYGIDYIGKVQANGGTTIRLVAADRNCSMIKNCGPNNNGAGCNAPITIANVDPIAKAKNPTFDFTKAYNGQWISMVVTDVVAN